MKNKRGYYDVFVKTCGKYPSRTAMRIYEEGRYKRYTYSELYGVCEYIAQTLQHFHCNQSIIGLVSKRNILIPCVVAAAHKCCDSFMFLDPSQDIQNIAGEMKFSMIVSILTAEETTAVLEVLGQRPDKSYTLFDHTISFFSYISPSQQLYKQIGYSFIAMTSGSTGEPKKIQVPIHSIQPNIDDLTKMFEITPQDVIYFSTPLTFDPSMIEILLACMNGASLLIAPELADVLFPDKKHHKEHAVTIWQTTPSRFFQLPNSGIKKTLSQKSPLKILALGGEPLYSLKRLKQLKHKDNQTKIYTLYGVTEMSCWACAAEVDMEKCVWYKEIPLGNCLSETEIVLESNSSSDHEKIILVSKTRKCSVLNKNSFSDDKNTLKFVNTGDLGEMKNGTIYYRGRMDDIVKRFGHKINLQLIQNTVMHCPRVKASSCIWLPKPKLLVLYYSSDNFSSRDLSDFLKCKLDEKHWPDKIIRVNDLPMNPHGKISKTLMAKYCERQTQSPITSNNLAAKFMKQLRSHLNVGFSYEEAKDKDFFSLGGTSFLAVSLCNKLSQTESEWGGILLPHLMNPMNTIGQVMETVVTAQTETSVMNKKGLCGKKKLKRRASPSPSSSEGTTMSKRTTSPSPITDQTHPVSHMQLIVLWTYDTLKCVDASPTVIRTELNLYVAVGSHSGRIVTLDVLTGEVAGMVRLKSRVEAAVCCYDQAPCAKPVGIVGAYDGTIVCFEIDSGEEKWRTNIGSMIKSKAVVNMGYVYIASYDGIIRRLDLLTGAVKDVIVISDHPISADLVLAKNEYVLTGTLSGMCASMNTSTTVVAWRALLSSPVFASPALYDNDKYVVFAEVNGQIHCRTVEKGIKIWSYLGMKGNIFSSFYVREDEMKWQFIFGCHDHHLYCVTVKNFQPSLQWKSPFTSPIYATPCRLNDTMLVAASNNGEVTIVSSYTGSIVHEFHLGAETFSSPAVYEEFVFIGCRNDNLYAFKCLN